MLPTRILGTLVRTKAGRAEVLAAWFLGGVLGFLPGFFLPTDLGGGFAQAPGIVVAVFVAALVLRVHLGMFGVALVLAKLVSLPLLPITHALGCALVDGLEPVFAVLRDTPLVAWCGPERYATVGGLVLGATLGGTGGWFAWRLLQAFRRVMAQLDDTNSFGKVAGRRSVRWLSWAVVGGDKGKRTWAELADAKQRRAPVPRVRWLGVLVAAPLAVGAWFVHDELAGRSFREATKVGLEDWNGATVDVGAAEFSVLSGRLRIAGLAIADREQLDVDAFRAAELALDFDVFALAQRRLVVDRVVAIDARAGVPRSTPAERFEPAPEPPSPPTPPPAPRPTGEAGAERALDDWIDEAEIWFARLQQVADWVEYLGVGANDGGGGVLTDGSEGVGARGADDGDGAPAEDGELFGFATAASRAIDARHPSVLIREIALGGIRLDGLDDGDVFDLRATNVSSHPSRVDAPMELTFASRSGRYRLTLRREPGADAVIASEVVVDGLNVDDTLAALGVTGGPVAGGSMRVRLAGRFDANGAGENGAPTLSAPLTVETTGATLALPGVEPTSLDGITLTFGVRGPLANPRIAFDDDGLRATLIARGERELAAAFERHAVAWFEQAGAAPLVESVQRALDDQGFDDARSAAEREVKKGLGDVLNRWRSGGKR